MNLKNKLDDKYEEELFENVDYDSLSFYLHDLTSSSIDIGCTEAEQDDSLLNLSFSVGDL